MADYNLPDIINFSLHRMPCFVLYSPNEYDKREVCIVIIRSQNMKKKIRIKPLNYSALQPPKPTKKNEICKCKKRSALKLMGAFLFFNPIHCVDCNLEVKPASLKLNQKTIDEIANWSGLYGAIDQLWLDSAEYEEWAKTELTNMESRINKLGLSANRSMNKLHKCYYWYFQDESDENFLAFKKCPSCKGKLTDYNDGIFKQRICERCLIIGSG